MAATTKTNYTSTVRTHHLEEVVKIAMGNAVASKFATSQPIQKGAGDTVRIARLLRPTKATSALTMGTCITNSSATNLTANHYDMSLVKWGGQFGFDEDVDVVSWIKQPENKKIIANHMTRSLEYQTMKTIARGGFRWRIDADTAYQMSATSGTSTTSAFVSATLDETTDDFWKGGTVTIYNPEGTGYDITGNITGFTASTDSAACTWPQAPVSTVSKGWVCVGTAIAATDVLTTTGLLYVAALHEKFETEKFQGGLLRGFIDAAQKRDLWTDTTFVNSAIYDASDRFANYSIVRWWDMELLVGSEIYREDVDGTENQATGVVYVTPIFGANSYAVYSFANPGGSGKFGVSWHMVDTPDSQNLDVAEKYLSWKSFHAKGVTRATSVINLLTGATSLGVAL